MDDRSYSKPNGKTEKQFKKTMIKMKYNRLNKQINLACKEAKEKMACQ